jgi:hypothetical protein
VQPEPSSWTLDNVIAALDSWVERENPSQDLRLIVAIWAMNRHEDPYRGMRRQAGFPNLWFGTVPETSSQGRVVTCTCMIFELTRTVRFDNFTTLTRPF